jgi:flavodoxin
MKSSAVIVYDSYFQNTKKVAEKVAEVVSKRMETRVYKVDEIKSEDINEKYDLVIVGSPTRGFRPTPPISKFLKELPELNNVKIMAFDTRASAKDIDSKILRPFLTAMMGTFGYAAEPIAKGLKSKGGEEIASPIGFLVKDTEGPLKEGELERAENWAKEALKKEV